MGGIMPNKPSKTFRDIVRNDSLESQQRAMVKRGNYERELIAQTKNKINNRFATITYVYIFIFLAMTAYLCYFLGFKSDSFINNPYNPRINNLSDSVIRGDIK